MNKIKNYENIIEFGFLMTCIIFIVFSCYCMLEYYSQKYNGWPPNKNPLIPKLGLFFMWIYGILLILCTFLFISLKLNWIK